jgi:phosphatidate cytidylyltransferase
VGDLKKRVLSGLALGPLVLILFVFLPPKPFLLFLGAILMLAVYELASMARLRNLLPIVVLTTITLIPLYADRPDAYALCLLFSPAFYLLFRLFTPASHGASINKEIGASLAVLVMSQVFLTLPLFALYLLKELDRYLPLILLLTIWASDTAAYVVGKSMGTHKLAPQISPKKTVEGLLGAMGGSLVVTFLFAPHLGLNVPSTLAMGLAIGILGQLGDILESIAKRVWEVKDSSSLIPGHGGILDRIDSILLNAPFMYCCLSWFRT